MSRGAVVRWADVLRLGRWGAVEVYALGLVAAALGLTLALAERGLSLDAPLWIVAALACGALVAEKQSVRITARTETSVSVLPILFAAVVYGPFEAMVVGACALLPYFGRPFSRWAIWTSIRSLAGGLAGLVALLLLSAPATFGEVLLAAAAAALVEAVTDFSLTSVTAVLRRGYRAFEPRTVARFLLATVPLYALVIGVLAYAYIELSGWAVLLFLAPAVAAHRLLVLYQEQRRLADDLAAANKRLERASLSFATALVSALDARDHYTAGHSAAVAVYTRDIAARLGLSEEEQRFAHLCGLLHDVGKVGLPAAILENTGRLTLEEHTTMQEHTLIGERILAHVDDYADIAKIVRHHHERVDGRGYPDGLSGEQIPLLSRIIAVADAYNAMTSGRPYREALPSRIARLELVRGAGHQFDRIVVNAFEALLAAEGESYLRGERPDFAVEALDHPSLTATGVASGASVVPEEDLDPPVSLIARPPR